MTNNWNIWILKYFNDHQLKSLIQFRHEYCADKICRNFFRYRNIVTMSQRPWHRYDNLQKYMLRVVPLVSLVTSEKLKCAKIPNFFNEQKNMLLIDIRGNFSVAISTEKSFVCQFAVLFVLGKIQHREKSYHYRLFWKIYFVFFFINPFDEKLSERKEPRTFLRAPMLRARAFLAALARLKMNVKKIFSSPFRLCFALCKKMCA